MLGRKVLLRDPSLLYNVRVKNYINAANSSDEDAYTEFHLAFNNHFIKLTGTRDWTLINLNLVEGDVVTLITWGSDESRHLDGLCKIIDNSNATPAQLQQDIVLSSDCDPEGAPLNAKIESLITAPLSDLMCLARLEREALPDLRDVSFETEIKKEKPAPKHTPAAKQDPVFMKDLPRYEEKILNGADAVEVGVGSRSVLALLDKEKDESKRHLPYIQAMLDKLNTYLKYAPSPKNKESIKSSLIAAPICFAIVWLLLTNPLVKWLFSGEWISIAAMLVFALLGMIGMGFIGAAVGFFGSGLVFSFVENYIPTDILVLWLIAGAVGLGGVVGLVSAISESKKMAQYKSKAKQDEGKQLLAGAEELNSRLQELLDALRTKGVHESQLSSYYKKEKEQLEEKINELKQVIKA